MSKTRRVSLRESYMQAWYQMDAAQLLATTAPDFIFDDPFEPEPVTRDMLPGYMLRWDQRTRELGSNNQWKLTHELRQDKNGILTDWEWWEVLDTSLQGAAVVLTGNDGVLLERITYFDR
jgi:hypothetical protein